MGLNTIGLHNLKINSMDVSSTLNIGRAHMEGSYVANHRNEGFGEQNADGVIITHSISIVEDSDFMDKGAIKRYIT